MKAPLATLAFRPQLPPRTVRLRLTLLYCGLFIVSSAVLLGLTYLFVRHSTGDFLLLRTVGPRDVLPGASLGTPPDLPFPAEAREAARLLQARAERQRQEVVEQLLTQSGIALAIMSVVSIALGWIVAGRTLRPLEAAFEAQRRFVANASHELRTPLAMMRTSLDVATGKPGPIPVEITALDGKLREGLDQADRLLESFLTLSRAQYGELGEEAEVSLAALAEAAVQARGEQIAARRLQVRLDGAEAGARVRGSETLLAQLVANLVDNAVLHNVEDGWLSVAAHPDGDHATLVVESGGARLDARRVRELTEPFQRLGAERTGSTRGQGLGLSIVAAIAEAHGGRVALAAREQGGLRVTVQLPLAQPERVR